ncbi:MSP (Major sperm protein) domain family protein [Acanthocheilonema viteae]
MLTPISCTDVPCNGGFTTHTLECVGTSRLCFRVRLKKKYFELYRVNPPVGFLRPGQKKQIILERRPGKPGRTFLVVEYIVAPSGYDPRNPFIEGAEVGRVKIRVRAYQDKKIADTVLHLQGQAVTQRGQKFQTPAVVNDEKIEREIEELYGKKDAPMFEFDDQLTDPDEEDDEEKKAEENKVKRLRQKIHSPKKPPPSQPKKKDVGTFDGVGAELIETMKGKVEKVSGEFETMKSLIEEQQKKIDDKLEKALSDLPFMKFVLILIIILFLLHLLFLRD